MKTENLATLCTLLVLFALTGCSGGSSSAPPPEIQPLQPAQGFVTRNYSETLSVTNGTAPLTWRTSDNIPGLTLSAAGVLSGTPTDAGDYAITVTVTDAQMRQDSIDLTIRVQVPAQAIVQFTGTYLQDSGSTNPLESQPYIIDEYSTTFDTQTRKAVASSSLYRHYNDEDELEVASSSRFEINYDGNDFYSGYQQYDMPDDVLKYTRVIEKDSEGRLLVDRRDHNADGIYDFVQTKTRDATGRVTSSIEDRNGTLSSHNVYTYNATGKLAARQIDFDVDGIFNSLEERDYDPANPERVIERRVDWDADSIWDTVTTVTWVDNTDGSITRTEERVNQGRLDEILTFEIPASKVADYAPQWSNISCSMCTRAERLTIPRNEPSYVSLLHEREFDENGRQTLFRHTQNLNNYVREQVNVYDAEGKPIRYTQTTTNDSLSGSSVYELTAEYVDWTIGNARSPLFNIGSG